MPNGSSLGRFKWLNEAIDKPLANALLRELGLLDSALSLKQMLKEVKPYKIVKAKEEGLLSHIDLSHRPSTVYYPDPRFINPPARPSMRGEIRFLTEGGPGSGTAEDQARINLGGQENQGFAGIPNPTAEQVWNYRRQFQLALQNGEVGENEVDHSDGIDLVFCPAPDAATSPTPASIPIGNAAGNRDPHSQYLHQPTNPQHAGPGRDQTHRGRLSTPFYQTRLINGKYYTVDRSRTHAKDPEPCKLWIVNKKGIWKPYPHAVDWDDPSIVERLNKHREQAFDRAGWPSKRDDARPSYTYEQRKWLFDKYVVPNRGERPSDATMSRITQEYARQFPGMAARNLSGITALYDRLRKEYNENDGQMAEHRRPGPRRNNRPPPSGDSDREINDQDGGEDDDDDDQMEYED